MYSRIYSLRDRLGLEASDNVVSDCSAFAFGVNGKLAGMVSDGLDGSAIRWAIEADCFDVSTMGTDNGEIRCAAGSFGSCRHVRSQPSRNQWCV